jgi:hypothetical protein
MNVQQVLVGLGNIPSAAPGVFRAATCNAAVQNADEASFTRTSQGSKMRRKF